MFRNYSDLDKFNGVRDYYNQKLNLKYDILIPCATFIVSFVVLSVCSSYFIQSVSQLWIAALSCLIFAFVVFVISKKIKMYRKSQMRRYPGNYKDKGYLYDVIFPREKTTMPVIAAECYDSRFFIEQFTGVPISRVYMISYEDKIYTVGDRTSPHILTKIEYDGKGYKICNDNVFEADEEDYQLVEEDIIFNFDTMRNYKRFLIDIRKQRHKPFICLIEKRKIM